MRRLVYIRGREHLNDLAPYICSYICLISIFVFPFLCFLVHKRKNDKTEIIFRFSGFCVRLYINGKTIKRKSNFVFRYLCFFFRKNKKTMKRKSNFVHLFLEKESRK